MICIWTQRRPYFKLQWLGPNKILMDAVSTMEDIEARIAVITGPKGEDGFEGPPGPPGPKGEDGTLSGEVTLLDGGNF
jgi:hypothetical protein